MKTTELRTGLYFTLPKENLEKTRELGNDYILHNPYWKRRTYYTAIKFEDEWYMINVYTTAWIDDEYTKDTEIFLKRMEEFPGTSALESGWSDNSCLIKLNDESLSLFNFEFDIRDKEIIDAEEFRYYKPGEIKFEHLSSWQFLCFKDKDTKKDPIFVQYQKIDRLAEVQGFPKTNKNMYEDTIKYLKEMDVDNQGIIEEIEKYCESLKNMEHQLEEMKKDFKWIDPTNGRIDRDKANEFLLGKNNID